MIPFHRISIVSPLFDIIAMLSSLKMISFFLHNSICLRLFICLSLLSLPMLYLNLFLLFLLSLFLSFVTSLSLSAMVFLQRTRLPKKISVPIVSSEFADDDVDDNDDDDNDDDQQ